MELENMGVPHVLLSRLSVNELCEIYCFITTQLMVMGDIDNIPFKVPDCLGLTDALLEKKLMIIS